MNNENYEITIVIPVFNEEKNINLLVDEIFSILKDNINFEIIIVNDCSTDDFKNKIIKSNYFNNLLIINHKYNQGQSFSILSGIKKASCNNIVTIDGDGQNNPADIIKIYNEFIKNKNLSLVGGIRRNRKDKFIKIFSSKIANHIRKKILKDKCDDTGCSLKIFEKDKFLMFPFFNGIHRFLPALYMGYGFTTSFIDVDHRERKFGNSKYGTFKRLINGILDLIKVAKILRKYKKNCA